MSLGPNFNVLVHVAIDLSCRAWYGPCQGRLRITVLAGVQHQLIEELQVVLARIRRGPTFAVPHPTGDITHPMPRLVRHCKPCTRDWMNFAGGRH